MLVTAYGRKAARDRLAALRAATVDEVKAAHEEEVAAAGHVITPGDVAVPWVVRLVLSRGPDVPPLAEFEAEWPVGLRRHNHLSPRARLYTLGEVVAVRGGAAVRDLIRKVGPDRLWCQVYPGRLAPAHRGPAYAGPYGWLRNLTNPTFAGREAPRG